MNPVEPVQLALAEADEALAQARRAVELRRSRQALRLAHLAAFQAVRALGLQMSAGLGPVEASAWAEAALTRRTGAGPAAYYRSLTRTRNRLEADPASKLHIEEASTWVRQTVHFVHRLQTIVNRAAA